MLKPRPKILIADDDINLRRLLTGVLPGYKYETYEASDGDQAWGIIKDLSPDIVILDVMMPGLDGIRLCGRIREDPRTRNIPVIMLTARAGVEDKLKGIESGADDCITKPFDPLELQARVDMHLRRHLRESDMSPVTGLPGNKAIEASLRSRIESGRRFALCYADLDDFKAYNDHYGFFAGSEVIRMTGAILREALDSHGGEDDFLGHVGGDDFVLLTSIERAGPICKEAIRLFDERIRSKYDAADLERGYITGTDRGGYTMRFPIMTISISVVHNENRQLTDSIQVGKIAAELKKYAKNLEGSVLVFDRRRS